MHTGDPIVALAEMMCKLTCVRVLRAKLDRRGRCKCGSTFLLKMLPLTEVQMQNLRSVLAWKVAVRSECERAPVAAMAGKQISSTCSLGDVATRRGRGPV